MYFIEVIKLASVDWFISGLHVKIGLMLALYTRIFAISLKFFVGLCSFWIGFLDKIMGHYSDVLN